MPNSLPPGLLRTPARAPYAADAARSPGRLIPEPESPTRTPFQRDRDRIIHSTAFRRLAHKTQVLVPHEGDHFRTRLTHSLEVAQIARSAARALGLDDDLAEALALAHDLGHTPFGHTGEDALGEAMAPYGGFDHNAQALRIVTKLERRYTDFDGLNLTWETLEGLVKHNGPLLPGRSSPSPHAKGSIPAEILEFSGIFDLRLSDYPTIEAQVAAAADGIAYNAHDLDDGLRASLISLEQTDEVEFICTFRKEIVACNPSLEPFRAIHELVRRTIAVFIEDLIGESWRRIETSGVRSGEDIAAQARPLIGFSRRAEAADNSIRNFLQKNVYRHPRLTRIRQDAGAIVRNLFARFLEAPGLMPPEWAEAAKKARAREAARARIVCDYIAGMTDRYACAEHRRLFGETQDLRLGAAAAGDAVR